MSKPRRSHGNRQVRKLNNTVQGHGIKMPKPVAEVSLCVFGRGTTCFDGRTVMARGRLVGL